MRAPSTSEIFTLIILLTGICLSQPAFAAELVDIRGPDVTIIEEEDRTVLEYRQGGVLRMVRIVPEWGKPYYLVPQDNTAGHESLERAETLLPNWVIVEF